MRELFCPINIVFMTSCSQGPNANISYFTDRLLTSLLCQFRALHRIAATAPQNKPQVCQYFSRWLLQFLHRIKPWYILYRTDGPIPRHRTAHITDDHDCHTLMFLGGYRSFQLRSQGRWLFKCPLLINSLS